MTDVSGKKSYFPKKFPALLIARMATQDNLRGKGIGEEMLARVFATAFNLCSKVGCRVVKVDAKKQSPNDQFLSKAWGIYKKWDLVMTPSL